MKLLLLHGWGGSDFPHWQAWLAAETAKNYGTVSFPLIKHPHYPHLNRWRKEVLHHLEDFRPDTVVTHSLAGTLWFHLASSEKLEKINRLILVALPSLTTKLETLGSFYPCPLPEKLYASEIRIVVGDDDPYISVDEARNISDHFGASLTILPNAGHINTESGYGKWQWILEEIKK
jgi:predicted alpha/beta hydrolase family esterase